MKYCACFLTLAFATVSCAQSEEVSSGPVGAYALESVNDVAIPATIPWDGDSLEFMAAELEVKADSTYRMTAPRVRYFADTSQAPIAMLDSFEEGTWTLVNDSTLHLTPMLNGMNRNFSIPATLSGGTLVTRRPGSTKHWTRR